MRTSEAEVRVAKTLKEALRYRSSHPDAMLLAGGTDLMVAIADGEARPRRVLDIHGLAELRGVEATRGGLRIGALTTYSDLVSSQLANTHLPTLVEAARACGGLQIRNRGTLGGAVAGASPAGDSLPVLLSLDAEVELRNKRSKRQLPLHRFFVGYRQVAMRPDEIITALHLPLPDAKDAVFFRKVALRRAQSVAKVILAARLRLHGASVTEARVAYGAMGPTPMRCPSVEEALVAEGLKPRVSALVLSDTRPMDDPRSCARHRQRVAVNVLRTWLETLSMRT